MMLLIAAFLLYVVATGLLLLRLRSLTSPQTSTPFTRRRWPPLALALLAVALHALLLQQGLFVAEGLDLGINNIISLTGWLVALLVLVSALGAPLENLGLLILPLAALALLAPLLPQGTPVVVTNPDGGLQLHILLSILSYSLLALAAAQALLLAIQDRHLRNRHPGGFIRALPPLETMELLLFRLIASGALALTLALASGALFIHDLLAQHLVHKTVLSIAAWAVFMTLLWGRWRFGWRGRTAIRWTLVGFVVLLIAFIGSKLVLELLLGSRITT